MMCLFQAVKATNVKTNEDFRKVLQSRGRLFALFIIIGIITASVAVAAELLHFVEADSWLTGIYSGIGSGLVAAGVVLALRNRKIMNDEGLLKEERLKSQDERNQMITAKAIQTAAFTLLFIAYAVMLVSAFFSRIIFFCFWFVALGFIFLYLIFYIYYSRKL